MKDSPYSLDLSEEKFNYVYLNSTPHDVESIKKAFIEQAHSLLDAYIEYQNVKRTIPSQSIYVMALNLINYCEKNNIGKYCICVGGIKNVLHHKIKDVFVYNDITTPKTNIKRLLERGIIKGCELKNDQSKNPIILKYKHNKKEVVICYSLNGGSELKKIDMYSDILTKWRIARQSLESNNETILNIDE